MREFYESVGGTAKLASQSGGLAKRALKKLKALQDDIRSVAERLEELDPAEPGTVLHVSEKYGENKKQTRVRCPILNLFEHCFW